MLIYTASVRPWGVVIPSVCMCMSGEKEESLTILVSVVAAHIFFMIHYPKLCSKPVVWNDTMRMSEWESLGVKPAGTNWAQFEFMEHERFFLVFLSTALCKRVMKPVSQGQYVLTSIILIHQHCWYHHPNWAHHRHIHKFPHPVKKHVCFSTVKCP